MEYNESLQVQCLGFKEEQKQKQNIILILIESVEVVGNCLRFASTEPLTTMTWMTENIQRHLDVNVFSCT